MSQQTRGIVLSNRNYSETSIITKIYTLDFGMQSYIVKGAKRKKSAMNQAMFQALSLVEVHANHNKNSGLINLQQINPSPPYQTIPLDPKKRTVAIFLADLLTRCIKEEEQNEVLFDFLDTSFQLFDHLSEDHRDFHLYFMIGLSRYLGFYPSNNRNEENKYFDISDGCFTDRESETSLITDADTAALIDCMLSAGNGKYELDCNDATAQKLFSTIIEYYELHQLNGQKIASRFLIDEVLN